MNKIQHSVEIKAGLRQGFRDGTSKLGQRKCYGYEVSADSELVINEKGAEVVRRIFEQYAEGKSLGKIADSFARRGIPSPTGKPKWNREAIDRLLANEKYTGRVLLQKTVGGRDNPGYEARYFYHDTHESIIADELFRAAREERLQRSRNLKKSQKDACQEHDVIIENAETKRKVRGKIRRRYEIGCSNRMPPVPFNQELHIQLKDRIEELKAQLSKIKAQGGSGRLKNYQENKADAIKQQLSMLSMQLVQVKKTNSESGRI